jgi:multidrug resistance efflux pump
MAAAGANTKVQVQQVLIQPVRHTIAASRLLYTPPSAILQGPIWLIFIITFGAIAYSFWGRKDELVAAPMRLQREATTIQSVGGGIVVELPAQPNTYVKFGDLLVAIQEQTRLAGESEKEALERKKDELQKEMDKARDEYENQINQLQLQLQDYDTTASTRKGASEAKIKQIEEQLGTAQRTLGRQQEQLGVLQKQFDRKKALYDSRDITVTEFEAAQEGVFNQQKSIDDTRSQIAQIQVQLATAKDELAKSEQLKSKDQLQAELDQTISRRDRDVKAIEDKIAALGSKLEESKDLVEGVKFQENRTDYSSKFSGLITDVRVSKGQVIGAGAPLVTMVKESAPLEAMVLVENKDIGRLKKGDSVKIKYHAYPYQEYGIPEGTITEIATKPDDQMGGKYPVRIALASEEISKHGEKTKKLEIGIEGIAEIKVGEKRLIELVFRPLSKLLAPKEDEDDGAATATETTTEN